MFIIHDSIKYIELLYLISATAKIIIYTFLNVTNSSQFGTADISIHKIMLVCEVEGVRSE